MFRKLIAALRLPWSDKRLLAEALLLMALARLAVLTLPFRWVVKVLGKQSEQTPFEDNPAQLDPIRRVGSMVRRLGRHVPWTSKCLDQAIAAKIMLARRRISTTVYFGVENDKQGQLAAHAWLRAGTKYVTGGDIRRRFAVINMFADHRA